MKVPAAIFALVALCSTSYGADDGMPFGKITDADVERLDKAARSAVVELTKDMQRAYHKDAKALARVFQFSTTFTRLDGMRGHTVRLFTAAFWDSARRWVSRHTQRFLPPRRLKCSSASETFFTSL